VGAHRPGQGISVPGWSGKNCRKRHFMPNGRLTGL